MEDWSRIKSVEFVGELLIGKIKMIIFKSAFVCALGILASSTVLAEQPSELAQLCGEGIKNISSDPLGGQYFGTWDGKLSHLLTVTAVDGPKVVAYYSTGVYVPWGIRSGSCGRFEGTIEGGKINLSLRGGKIKVVYIIKDDELIGTYSLDGTDTPGTFKKIATK